MDNEIQLAQTGYEQACGAYAVAVDVTKFTWQMFYARSVALLTGAGVICIKCPDHWWVATILLLGSALITLIVTARQMEANQLVIRKCMAAGADLERTHNAFGFRFRLDLLGHRVSEMEEEGKTVVEVLESARNSNGIAFKDLGITPKTTLLCRCYAAAFAILALITVIIGLQSPRENNHDRDGASVQRSHDQFAVAREIEHDRNAQSE